MVRIIKLDQNDPSHWALYPRFEHRCLRFAERQSKYNQAQLVAFQQDLRNRWVQVGGGLYVAAIDADGRIVGHTLGWVNWDYGQPYLFVFQVESDAVLDTSERGETIEEVIKFVKWANTIYKTAGEVKKESYLQITKVKTETIHDLEAWKRYFARSGIEIMLETSVISFRV